MIPTRPLGTTGLHTTVIGFGALEIGRDWGLGSDERRRRPDDAEAEEMLHGALATGVNLIDTASAYHRSEERIGRYLSRRRSEFLLATKCGEHNSEPGTYYDFSYEAVRQSIDRSLQLLQTDVIDLLQIHFGPEPERVLDDGGCVRAMKEARDAGKVRFLGASVNGPALRRCIESGDFQAVQVGYSLLRQEEEEQIRLAQERGLGVLIRSGFAGGWLTRRTIDMPHEQRPAPVRALFEFCGWNPTMVLHLAVQFLLRTPGVSSVLAGSRSLPNFREVIRLAHEPVAASLLQEAVEVVRRAH